LTVVATIRTVEKAALRTDLRPPPAGLHHAISLDSDGQHLPGDIPSLLEAATSNPRALILESETSRRRARAGQPPGPQESNFWAFMTTGYEFRHAVRVSVLPARCHERLVPDGQRLRFRDRSPREVGVDRSPVGLDPDRGALLPRTRASLPHAPLRRFLRIAHLYAKFFFLRICLPPLSRNAGAPRLQAEQLLEALSIDVVELLVKEPGSPRAWRPRWPRLFMGIAPSGDSKWR